MAKIAFRNILNEKHVCADSDKGSVLFADRPWIRGWEEFEVIDLGDSKIALRAFNGKYVCAELDHGAYLVANRDWIRGWETFEMRTVAFPPIGGGHPQIALRCVANDRWVCAEMGDGAKLIANRTSVHDWESFYLIHLGS